MNGVAEKPRRYRKKPIVVEAVQFIGEPTEIAGPEPEWYRVARTIDRGEVGAITFVDCALIIHTLEGEMRANRGDWIVRGIKGELHPVREDIFRETYEPVEE